MKRLQISAVAGLAFGVHRDRAVDDLGHDFLCVLGPNESGKSTLAEFLQWMIAGPGGDTASAARFGDPRAQIGGRLLGALADEPLEISATFVLKANGVPNDSRQGHVGDRTCDGASLAAMFGALTPADYRLMHRLRGADLGLAAESKSFSDVFTRFAIGSDSAGVSPRVRLGELQSRSKDVARTLKAVRSSLKQIRGEISAAMQRPDDLARLEELLRAEGDRRAELGRRLAELRAHEVLLGRALEFIPVRQQLLRAEAELEQLGPLSEPWRQVSRSCDAVVDAHEKVQQQSEVVDAHGRRFERARAEVGLPIVALEGRELSLADRSVLLDAAQKVSTGEAQTVDALVARDASAAKILGLEADIARTAGVLGVEPHTGASLLGRAASIRSLLGDAGVWVDEQRRVTDQTATLAGLQRRLEQMPATPPSPADGATNRFSLRLLVALGGLMLAAGSALISPIFAVAIAVVTIIAALVVPDRPKSAAVPLVDSAEPVRREIAEAEQQLAGTHSRCSDVETRLGTALADLGASRVTQASLARTHVEQLADLASQVDQLDAERASFARLDHDLAIRRDAQRQSRESLADLLRARAIDAPPPVDEFASWLASYERALAASRDSLEAVEQLRRLQSDLDERIRPVLDELVDLNWPARLERIRVTRELLRRIEEQEARRRDAQLRISVLGDDRDQIEEILHSSGDSVVLEERLGELRDQIEQLDAERDEALTQCNDIASTIGELEATEELAGLRAEQGELEETEVELSSELEVLDRSASMLAEVIDRFEVENQDPLFKRTQQLLQRVVPDWGDLIFSRNSKSEVVIERRDAAARLDDSRLSDGARALLYLALRLAFTEADAERRNIALPILCDDPLVHLDDARRPGAIRLLAEASTSHQVVLFTCDASTASLAEQNGAHVISL